METLTSHILRKLNLIMEININQYFLHWPHVCVSSWFGTGPAMLSLEKVLLPGPAFTHLCVPRQ